MQAFPKLFCLDIAHNRLLQLKQTIIQLHGLSETLKMVYLQGNPLALATGYRDTLKLKLKTLKVLDGTPTLNEVEGSKKKKKAAPALGSYGQPVKVDLDALVADVQESFTLDLHLRVLNNVDGIYLTEETCKPEVLETLTQDSDKSSTFWLRYKDHQDKIVETEKKIWIQNFQVPDPAAGVGKTDFGLKLRLVEKPSVEFSDWMKRDLLVELWETRPRLLEKKNEETFETVKEVAIDPASGTPFIDKRIRGVLKLNLSDWVNKAEIKSEESQFHTKVSFYDPDLLQSPEFVKSNHYI